MICKALPPSTSWHASSPKTVRVICTVIHLGESTSDPDLRRGSQTDTTQGEVQHKVGPGGHVVRLSCVKRIGLDMEKKACKRLIGARKGAHRTFWGFFAEDVSESSVVGLGFGEKKAEVEDGRLSSDRARGAAFYRQSILYDEKRRVLSTASVPGALSSSVASGILVSIPEIGNWWAWERKSNVFSRKNARFAYGITSHDINRQ